VASGKELANFDHGGEVMQAEFSSDNRYAVSANDTSIRVWRLPNPTSSSGKPAAVPTPSAPAPPPPAPIVVEAHPATPPIANPAPATHAPAPPAPTHAPLPSEVAALEEALKQAATLDAFTRVTTDGFALLDRAAAAKDSATMDAVEKLIKSAAVDSKDIELGSDVRDRLREFDTRNGRTSAP